MVDGWCRKVCGCKREYKLRDLATQTTKDEVMSKLCAAKTAQKLPSLEIQTTTVAHTSNEDPRLRRWTGNGHIN